MSPRRRKRRGPPRCRSCNAVIRFWRIAGNWVPFDPTPMTGRDGLADDATPVWGNQGWDHHDLLIELVERQHHTPQEASEAVMAVDWFRRHRCPQRATAMTQQEVHS